MDMLMGLTLEVLARRIVEIIVVASVFIEITPIKISPITDFLRWIGKRLNKDVSEKIDKMESKVELLEKSDVIACRFRILSFSDEIRRGVKHSHEMFDQILSDIDVYDRYCADHPDFPNNKTVAAKHKILEVYSNCIDKDDFL